MRALRKTTKILTPNKKRPVSGPGVRCLGVGKGLGRFLLLRLLGRGAAVLALGGGVALDELDHRHRRHVAEAEAGLEDAQIAAAAARVARAERGEQLVGDIGVAQEADRLA